MTVHFCSWTFLPGFWLLAELAMGFREISLYLEKGPLLVESTFIQVFKHEEDMKLGRLSTKIITGRRL